MAQARSGLFDIKDLDGDPSFYYDKNGNPTSLVYPGGVEAVTTFDFADRPASLLARRSGSPDHPLVTAAGYLPSGPLSSLTLGNGLTETRTFNQRYFPASIDPCKYPGQVFKTVDFVEVTVQSDHVPEITVNKDTTPFTSYLGSNATQSNRGGWKGVDWLAKRHAERDYGWDDLFNKAKAGNCCCRGQQ